MTEGEVMLLKGNEAIAHAAIRCGVDGFFGYPITPQSEIIETLSVLKPWETTGMVVVQAESETSSINMVYGAAGAGKRAFTSSSSPGIALMQEGISYMAGCEIPGVVINISRGGPGLGTIQPSQADYTQVTRGGGNGDYKCIVLAPSTVQEMADFVPLIFDLAFKYRCVGIILSDGVIGQMMEKCILPPYQPRRTDEEICELCPWASTGRVNGRQPNIITSLELTPELMEERNIKMQEKYRTIQELETRYDTYMIDDAEYVITAFGISARLAVTAIDEMRGEGIKVGLFRPITLWPYPYKELEALGLKKTAGGENLVKGILCVEMNAGQMIEDVRLAVHDTIPVRHFGRMGGAIAEPNEIVGALKDWIPAL
ncbi:MAG: 3-methyl-2-oxobutanoate dehydrogenase subunit VorB [Bacteroidales bacterium]|nr:3-methyl-2-oxobutanoate dehydrogenase subunit VorB [Bacteroidales bacterium]MCM1147345.1 3-methyl-2-oxobutanoate dehydrogenase subunit VorB [Bacteroidales bacterium]MCM1206219.1 3-methyl-2-oxobutanoate dehydrogenase subunit VorB [Bacillota bacterium]MCM1510453.1 3-methyl-2-oxobutanoate dehydrogenase subunit VorB [Clostridium sp.]